MNVSDWLLTSVRYPVVVIGGFIRVRPDLWPFYLALGTALVLIVVAELRSRTIPHAVTIPAILAGLAIAATYRHIVPLNALLGCIGGFVALMLANRHFRRRRGRDGIGGGVPWMTAMVGAFVGVNGLLHALVAASLINLVVVWRRKGGLRGESAEFGPFMAVGTLLYVLLIF